jgi:anti-sigma B factor antagonist
LDALHIETEVATSHVVVRVAGELDAATAAELDEAIRRASSDSIREVVVDFAGLDFIDSSGLSVLVATHKRLGKAGAELRVVGLQPSVRRVFAIAGLDQVLTIAE